jgi:hypothetical protein
MSSVFDKKGENAEKPGIKYEELKGFFKNW